MSQASILVRGSPLTWRLTCSLSVGKDIIVGVHEVRVASTRSSITMPRAPDHAGHHQRVGDYVNPARALRLRLSCVAAG